MTLYYSVKIWNATIALLGHAVFYEYELFKHQR
jgi:hypothetical protein